MKVSRRSIRRLIDLRNSQNSQLQSIILIELSAFVLHPRRSLPSINRANNCTWMSQCLIIHPKASRIFIVALKFLCACSAIENLLRRVERKTSVEPPALDSLHGFPTIFPNWKQTGGIKKSGEWKNQKVENHNLFSDHQYVDVFLFIVMFYLRALISFREGG